MKNLKIGVMVSTMNQCDFRLLDSLNLKNIDTIIINQNGTNEIKDFDDTHRMICTDTKGLSKSRNIGLENVLYDVTVVSDDDETFYDDLPYLINKAYKDYPDADIIAFKIENLNKNYFAGAKKLKKYELLKISSVQITFKVESIRNSKIIFDECLGAGTGNGAGEENKFLLDCYKKGLKIYFVPITIGRLNNSDSTWFNGYTEKWFYNRGMSTRYILGFFVSILYSYYDFIKRFNVYKQYGNPIKFLWIVHKGIFENKLGRRNKC